MLTLRKISHFYLLSEGKKIQYHVIEFLDGTEKLFTQTDWEELQELTKP